MFGLPRGETIIDEFSCAVKRRIVLHGRMYVTVEHICFKSDIFGIKTIIVIAFRDVVIMRRLQAFSRLPRSRLPVAISLARGHWQALLIFLCVHAEHN